MAYQAPKQRGRQTHEQARFNARRNAAVLRPFAGTGMRRQAHPELTEAAEAQAEVERKAAEGAEAEEGAGCCPSGRRGLRHEAATPRQRFRAGLESVRHHLAVTAKRAAALERFERAVELPLLVLALAMVPLLVVPLLMDLPSGVEAALLAADWLIWGAFALEYVVRLVLTEKRWRFVRREWPDLLIIVLPFLRPLRVVRSARALRLLRLGRLVAVLGEVGQQGRRLLVRHRLHYAVLVTGVVVVAAAALVLAVEEGRDGTIDSFGDALWWAVTTVTTVGYGDMFPVTPAGRGIAAFLMVAGIALFGVLTANVAAFFIEQEHEQQGDPVAERLDEVLRRLEQLEKRLPDKGNPSPPALERLEPPQSTPEVRGDSASTGGGAADAHAPAPDAPADATLAQPDAERS